MNIVRVNIKKLREEKRISLRALARQLKVSASFLSQVEAGKASPSLVTLKNMADALNTTVGNLIGECQKVTSNPVVTESERIHLNRAFKGINIYLLATPDPNKQMEPLLLRLDEGADSGDSHYTHFGQEFASVIKGAIEITLNKITYSLKKGDSIYFNSNIPHAFKNIGKEKAEVIWVVNPPTF
ncbi:MAG: XRE family transcriptional regulator [Candidatus Omnitrophota bacterium]|jgi:transcriptional regulator with XRE-family HTH domain